MSNFASHLPNMINQNKNIASTVEVRHSNRSYINNVLRYCLSLYIIAAFSLCAAARDGDQSYSFLNITSSSKIYGLGGINISLVDDDIMTTDQNPALLGQEMSGQIALNYMRYIGGVNYAGIRYGQKVGEHGTWGAAIQYNGYGSMKETDEAGNIIGTFSAQDINFSGQYSYDITDRLRGGIAVKFLYNAYAGYTAMALATDLGINYYNPDKDLSLSFVAANLGGQIKKFDNSYDRLPIDIRLGWSQTFGTLPIRFSVTAWNLTKWHLPYYESGDGTETSDFKVKDSFSSNLFRHLVFGADLVSSPNWYLGIGYNYKTRTDMSTYSRSFLSGFSIAGGLRVKAFGIGLAFAQPHTGATTFMLNISCNLRDLF